MTFQADSIGFVHLHTHSSYSLLEGAITVEALAKLALADKQPALALTDTNNLYGALEFSEKLWGMGVQPSRIASSGAPPEHQTMPHLN